MKNTCGLHNCTIKLMVQFCFETDMDVATVLV